MLDLLEISLPAPDELCLKFKNDVQLNFVTKDYEQIVQQIHSMFVKCYPGMPEACHYTVVAPLERKDKSKEKNSSECTWTYFVVALSLFVSLALPFILVRCVAWHSD
jgi:hypothetical protein